MKKIFNILLAVAMSAAALSLSSCKDETLDPDNPGGTQTDPSTFPDPLDHSSVAYPIAWTPYVVEQGADGVSIEVTSLSEKDFTFVAERGGEINYSCIPCEETQEGAPFGQLKIYRENNLIFSANLYSID